MHLKKLEIQGFKSFPEYTLIEFDEGMTAVVGPNGSGKSNVTDAVRWVLGEQSVKSLRGGKMEDVIFNGTQSRKPMNYAEVSITLDNSDKYIDYEYDEIQITRRLYRSGESEYQINKVNCRLKDIIRLFLDTGLGKDGYSIVGQGKVDEVLSTKSEDRRRVIEEASGIVKYKVRKDEAERKLNSTEQNLTRIDDILNELTERVGPLKEQAEKAAQYHKAYEALKENDIAMLVRKIDDAENAMGDSSDIKKKLEEEIKEQEDRYLDLRNSNSELSEESERLDEKIEDKRQELSDVTEEYHDISVEIKVCEERIKQLETRSGEIEDEVGNFNEDLKKLRDDHKKHSDKADQLLKQASEEKKKAEDAVLEREQLLEKFRDSEESQNKIKRDIESKTNELIDTKDRINTSNTRIDSLKERLDELSSARESYIQSSEELKAGIKKADELWREMMEKEGEVTSDIEQRNEKIKSLSKKESKMLADYESMNRKFLSDKSRLKTLNELEKRKEGYQESVRRLMNEAEADPSVKKGIFGIIGDLISTDKKYDIAVETALGNAIHNVVTRKEQDAADLIRILKERHLGRVTFLPIENIKPRSIERNTLSDAKRQAGFIGVASDLVECDKEIRDIIENLLGKIIICDDMDSARTIARAVSHSVKVITLSGDSVNPGGSLTGGSIRKDSVGILGRSREIEDLKKDIDKQEQDLSVIEAQRQLLDEESGDLKREIAQLEEQLKYFSMERVKAETEYRNLNSRSEDLDSSIKDIEAQIGDISTEKLRLEDDLEELVTIAKETEGELSDFRDDILKSDNIAKEFNDKLDILRDRISAMRTESERILAERNGVMQLASHIKEEIARKEYDLNSRISENEEIRKEASEIRDQLKSHLEKREKLAVKNTELSEKVKELSTRKSEIDKNLSGFVSRLTEINDVLTNLRNRHNALINKYEKYINDIDLSKNRLWEDYETTYDNVKGKYPEVTNIAETGKIITKLRNEIKGLGPVNLAAIDEYKEVSERFEFLTSQRDDIATAKANLEKVIADLVEEMKKQFVSQFTVINENFKTVFTDLFNGGSAEIILENEEDVLNCNIEIKAQPPGKRLQSLTLLSGGERCLTAIALLFAILQLRPSPFVILDEVEAALDDVNVTRFTDFVRRYTARSQFILVTHRKGTMEACDRMYGVTMQERGISKILSMRIQ